VFGEAGWTGIFAPIFVLGALFLLAGSFLARRLDRLLATYARLVLFYVGRVSFRVSNIWSYLSPAAFM
jgi:hypothetical protein